MARLRNYPFLTSLGDYTARAVGVSLTPHELAKDPYMLDLALARLRADFEGSRPPQAPTVDDEVMSFHLAAAIAGALGQLAVKVFAEAEASRALAALKLEDEEGLMEVSRALGVPLEKRPISIPWLVEKGRGVRRRVLPYRVHVSGYLRVAAVQDGEGALTNAFLLGGWVYLDRALAEDLLYKAFVLAIARRASENTVEDLPSRALAIARAALENSIARRSGRLARLDEEALPPCIRAIMDRAAREGLKSLGDEEGYMLASFLAYIDVDVDWLSGKLGVGAEEASALLSLARMARSRGYRPYTCKAAKELGICSWDCRGPTPLSEYHRRLRSARGSGG